MEINMDPLQKQMLDDVFDAFTLLGNGGFVSLMHVEGGFTRYSASAVEMLGLPGEYIPNGAMDWNDYLHPDDRRRYMEVMTPLIEGRTQTYDISYRIRLKSGDYGSFRAVGAVLRGGDGSPSLIGGVTFNEGLTNNVDPVTALPNKRAWQEELTRLMAAGKPTVSLMAGFDNFNDINQVHGFTYGNRVLQETAWMLRELVRERGVIYRMDDAAFVILSDTLTREEAAALYDMIRYRMQRGIEVGGMRNTLSASGGMLSVASAEADAAAITACLTYAYEESRNRHYGDLVDFNGSITDEGARKLALLSRIRDCAADDCRGFSMEYIPVINAVTERPNGAEGTLCWSDGEYGRVPAEDFVPILERDFIFEELGEFILAQGLADGMRFLQKDPGYLLCLNIYRIQLESGYFVENLTHHLRQTGFPPHLLSLKLDADCRYIETGRVRDIVVRLHELGVLVIIDGFGSGNNSIGFLKNVPVDAVCMGEQFINGIEEPGRDRDILENLTKLASTCVKHINIRGVSTQARREALRGMPITTMQGSYFSRPLTFDEMTEKYYR